MKELFKQKLASSLSYPAYRDLVEKLLSEGKTTGPNQSEMFVKYTDLNHVRLKRLEKTIQLNDDLLQALEKLKGEYHWLVLVEAWCGDVAQNLPILQKMADATDSIELSVVLRDENLDLMEHYKTNGGISIPKLVAIEKESLTEVFNWGPRPAPAQALVLDYKKNPTIPYPELLENVQRWYLKDKTQTLQAEFLALVSKLG